MNKKSKMKDIFGEISQKIYINKVFGNKNKQNNNVNKLGYVNTLMPNSTPI